MPNLSPESLSGWMKTAFENLLMTATCLGGSLQTQMGQNGKTIQVLLTLPDLTPADLSLHIACRQSLLQTALTQLAYIAGLKVTHTWDGHSPILTDELPKAVSNQRIIWVQSRHQSPPKGVYAQVNLSVQPTELRAIVEAVTKGSHPKLSEPLEPQLSEREQEILRLLGHGSRDRDIAQQLMISESTVKFHLNNVMTKLKARTRYQALYQAMAEGWL